MTLADLFTLAVMLFSVSYIYLVSLRDVIVFPVYVTTRVNSNGIRAAMFS